MKKKTLIIILLLVFILIAGFFIFKSCGKNDKTAKKQSNTTYNVKSNKTVKIKEKSNKKELDEDTQKALEEREDYSMDFYDLTFENFSDEDFEFISITKEDLNKKLIKYFQKHNLYIHGAEADTITLKDKSSEDGSRLLVLDISGGYLEYPKEIIVEYLDNKYNIYEN